MILEVEAKKHPPGLINNKTNWIIFKQMVEEYINLKSYAKQRTSTDNEVEKYIDMFTKSMQDEALQNHKNSKYVTIYRYEAIVLIRKKRKAQKTWQSTPEN